MHKSFENYSSEQDAAGVPEKDKNMYINNIKPHRARIFNGRDLQATFDSPQAMFEKHGFCLLQHKTAVKEWNSDYAKLDTDVTNIYHDEILNLLENEVFKGQNIDCDKAAL